MVKLLLLLTACSVAIRGHHIPGHVVDTQPVLLAIQGVPIQVAQEGDYYVIRDLAAPRDVTSVPGVFVPSGQVEGSLHVVSGALADSVFSPMNNLKNLLLEDRHRTKRGLGFSYTAPGGTAHSEYVDSYSISPDKNPINRITGRVSWRSPEGIPFTLNYVADGKGFHPEGNHLPSSPLHRQYFPK
ncbi:hypothetical protein J6590_000649 [Homalodisca vitripennis]|nr:hypothetical protein J6590_000649 [Homalodisca vitripennis]